MEIASVPETNAGVASKLEERLIRVSIHRDVTLPFQLEVRNKPPYMRSAHRTSLQDSCTDVSREVTVQYAFPTAAKYPGKGLIQSSLPIMAFFLSYDIILSLL